MPGCLRCDPILHTGYPPGITWPPGWGGVPGGPRPPLYPLDALAILSIAPNTAVCLTPGLTVTATGQNFTASTEILFDGNPAALGRATFVSPTQMTFTVDPTAEPIARTAKITCRDTAGYGAGLGACDFQFTAAPVLTVTCPLQPASALINSGAQTVTVKGTLFTNASIVMLDGADQATSFVDANTLTFELTPGAVAATHTVSVKDGANTAVQTCPFQVTLTPLLTVTCPCVPATAVAGTPDIQVTVNGTNFTDTAMVTLDGADQATTFVSATRMTFSMPVSTETVASTKQVGARDGANTAVASCSFEITAVAVVRPTVTYVFPDEIGMDDPVKSPTVTGTGFDDTSVVILSQEEMVTRMLSATSLEFDTVSPMWSNGDMTLRVQNGGTSDGLSTSSLSFMVANNPGKTSQLMLIPTTGAAGSTVRLLGSGLGMDAQVTVNGVGVTTTWVSGGEVTFAVPAEAPGTVLQCSVRLGHQHPEGHDNVTPQPMQNVPFTVS